MRNTKSLYTLLFGLCFGSLSFANSVPTPDTIENAPSQPANDESAEVKPITDAEVMVLINDGKKIEAIKAFRETHKVSLKEAVNAVNKIQESAEQKKNGA